MLQANGLTGLGMSMTIHDILRVQALTSSVVLHMAIEMVLGTERRILLTSFPATNEGAIGRFRRDKGAGMIFDMVVQVLDSSKNTIAWSTNPWSVIEVTRAGEDLTQ